MYIVRPVESADASAVARLTAASPEAAQWTEEAYARLADGGYAGWVAMSGDGAVSGFIITRAISSEAEILNLAVQPPLRRAGIAAALLEKATKSLLQGGVRRIFLEVRSTNSAAISFYKKHLFRATGYRPRYYQHPSEDAMLMERIFTATGAKQGLNHLPT